MGSGLLLGELAPDCAEYWATDFAAPTIETLGSAVRSQPWADRVTLRTQPAHTTDGLPERHFDTVVLNSVIQYFPDAAYLLDVLRKILPLLAPGGSIHLGDVRNHALLPYFAAAVELAQAGGTETADTVRERVRRAVLSERELLLAPEFFAALPDHLPGVTGVDIQLGRMRTTNELGLYRYSVVLHTGTDLESLGDVPCRSWARFGTITALADHLRTDQPVALRVTGVPHTGLRSVITAVVALDAMAGHALVSKPDPRPESARIVPADFDLLGAELGYRVAVTWSPDPGLMDVIVTRDDPAERATLAAPTDVYRPGRRTRQSRAIRQRPGRRRTTRRRPPLRPGTVTRFHGAGRLRSDGRSAGDGARETRPPRVACSGDRDAERQLRSTDHRNRRGPGPGVRGGARRRPGGDAGFVLRPRR